MGLYIRKSVRVGPFKFNLSKSGIGVSAGIKGLRVGTGPKGNYIHMGRGGFYYRQTLSSQGVPHYCYPKSRPTPPPAQEIQSSTHEPLRKLTVARSA